MKLGVLTSATSWYYRDLQRAASGSDQLIPLAFSTIAAGTGGDESWVSEAAHPRLESFDGILVRSMPPGSLEQIVFRMNALHRLESSGTAVFNRPRSLEIAIDKYLASSLLAAAGLRTPRTIATQTVEQAMQAFADLNHDVVVKPLFGSEGRGITRLTDEAVAWRTFKALAQCGSVIYLQQYIAHQGYDIRLLVVGERVLGIRRHNPSDWRTNISRGGRAEPLQVDDALRHIALRAADAVDSSLVAVDVLPGLDGIDYLLEVNAVPGWQALSRALGIDVAELVLRFIRERIRR